MPEDGYKIRRQHPLARSVVDFDYAEAFLAIELDGDHHDEFLDELRDAELAIGAVKVLRFRNAN